MISIKYFHGHFSFFVYCRQKTLSCRNRISKWFNISKGRTSLKCLFNNSIGFCYDEEKEFIEAYEFYFNHFFLLLSRWKIVYWSLWRSIFSWRDQSLLKLMKIYFNHFFFSIWENIKRAMSKHSKWPESILLLDRGIWDWLNLNTCVNSPFRCTERQSTGQCMEFVKQTFHLKTILPDANTFLPSNAPVKGLLLSENQIFFTPEK